jgi:hypothetical protein
MKYPTTPDLRYFVVKGRLWRMSNPNLTETEREKLTYDLMMARRDVKKQKEREDARAEKWAHAQVDRLKKALGERGPVWWANGDPANDTDYNRHKAKDTPYAEWYASLNLSEPESETGPDDSAE